MSTTCMYIITVFTCYALLTALIVNCIDWDFFIVWLKRLSPSLTTLISQQLALPRHLHL